MLNFRTVKFASFQLLYVQYWKSLLFVSEASINLIQSFDVLFDGAGVDVKWCEGFSVAVHQRIACEILRPSSCNAEQRSYYPHVNKPWLLGELILSFGQKIHHLQLHTNKPIILFTNFLRQILRRFIHHTNSS